MTQLVIIKMLFGDDDELEQIEWDGNFDFKIKKKSWFKNLQ